MGPTRSLAFWLALVDRLVEERFSTALEEHGVTRTQWRILGALSEGGATAEQIDAALADMPPGADDETPAEELDELIESEWVVADGTFALTDRGRAAYERLDEVVVELRGSLIEGIGEEEQRATADVLERMARNLGWNG
jgi:DNA-binding MarR family transcriptional regulator